MLRRRSCRRGAAGGGFTILEMMVTVAILSMIIASFSVVILQCNRMVTTAQRIMRANAKIGAISQLLRKDIQRITKGGIMVIRRSGTGAVMLLTTGEPMTTTRSATDCLGSYVVWGQKTNLADPTSNVLWRPEYGFTTARALGMDDVIGTSLAEVQAYSRGQASTGASSAIGKGANNLYYPAENLSQIDGLWQIVSGGCSELEIKWTDGSVDSQGRLIWHDSGMWTSDDLGEWPRAIMLRFRLADPRMPEDMDGKIYEIICELPP